MRSFLDLLTGDQVGKVLGLGPERPFPRRATLVRQGDPTQHVVLLSSGWAKVSSESSSGDELLLAIRGAKDIIGELSAIDGLPRSATVTALVPVRARVIRADRFVGHLHEHPDVMFAMLRHVAARLRESDAERLRYVSTSSSARTVGLLLDLADRHGVPTGNGILVDLPLTQQEMAKAAATSREMVARTLRILRERGLVRTSRQRIVLAEIDALRSMADSVPDDA
ncbi:Crp/Fnr family transcriptional regulator [Actinoplanes xinjiangensis]|uniref:CRP-like cAMP-binding protein n=1 Tax=Actinoplanes xinjiangensis TaxID=512350 RepID=A0A316EVI1_9ACTN|nr:Crp/Fnr family transcriptional regulator [Actinoplanes xinjiangensis]PWK35893.1 CRP-like cAMP-binding protein [Actinoplanes xinjiangensis]GIF43076.1 Crp/Fnr family transcriptional regulator [Actinoplanes xinjiangensis]